MDACVAQRHDHEGDKIWDPAHHESSNDEAQLPHRFPFLMNAHVLDTLPGLFAEFLPRLPQSHSVATIYHRTIVVHPRPLRYR